MENSVICVGFSRTDDLLGRLIRAFTHGTVNHAFLLWTDPDLGTITLGANQNGVSVITLAEFQKSRQIMAVFRPPADLRNGLWSLKYEIGTTYNTLGLIGMVGVEIARDWFNDRKARNLLSSSKELFCSQFVTEVIRHSGIQIMAEEAADTIDPENLMLAIEAQGWTAVTRG